VAELSTYTGQTPFMSARTVSKHGNEMIRTQSVTRNRKITHQRVTVILLNQYHSR